MFLRMPARDSDPLGLLLRAFALGGLVVIVFIAGAWVAWRDVPPFRDLLRNAFLGAEALGEARRSEDTVPRHSTIWRRREKRDTERLGVTVLDRDRAFPGPTLVMVGQSARLIALDGTVRHSWDLAYEKFRNPQALLRKSVSPSRLYARPGRVLAGGDLMAILEVKGHSPEGLALVRVDREGNPRWVFHGYVHHDFDVAPDGRVFALGQGVRAEPPVGLEMLRGPLVDERLYILSPGGELLEDLPLLETFTNSPYRAILERLGKFSRYDKGDYLHANNVDVATAATAARFDFVREGQVLLSLLRPSAVAVLDLPSRRISWARVGPWREQHDPDFLDNGNLLVFDNRGDLDRGGRSRVVEVDPRTGGIVWEYPGNGGGSLWSRVRGDQQRLPNGNTLINEETRGRLLEVTPGGEIVWEYRCPFPYPGDEPGADQVVCCVLSARRYAEGELDFPMNGAPEGR